MSDPLALLPFALAASSGVLDGVEAQQWVAAGHMLLTRSASLVRALSTGRAGILLPPSGAFLTALAASDGRGAVLVNPLASRSEIIRQIRDADISALFTTVALAALIPDDVPIALLDDAPGTAVVVVDGVTKTVDLGAHYGLVLTGSSAAVGRDEEAVIVYTSAMAGAPLGAILTHQNLLSNARASADAMGDTSDDHCLAALPFAHLFGLIVCSSAPLLQGARVTTMDRFHPARALEVIGAERVTRFMGVPSMFKSLLGVIAKRHGGNFSAHALRMCLSGGAVVTEELQDEWFHATGVELRQGYGLTEAAPACLLNRADAMNRRGRMGTPVAGTEVSIRDALTNKALPAESVGEICVRGPHVFRGYVSGGMHGLQVRDSWLHTGDLGVQHRDGSVSFRGLIKPMFTRNGFNIYPREIEAAFLRMPGVQTATVRGVPDDVKENNIAVRVTGSASESTLKQWAQHELAAYKVPSVFEVGEV